MGSVDESEENKGTMVWISRGVARGKPRGVGGKGRSECGWERKKSIDEGSMQWPKRWASASDP